jgi:hypothetical protein
MQVYEFEEYASIIKLNELIVKRENKITIEINLIFC